MDFTVHGKLQTLPDDASFSAVFNMTRADFARLRKWKQDGILKEVAKVPPFTYKFPHARAKPAPSIDSEKLDWANLQGMQHSSDGTEGVIFVLLPNDEAVVVKAGQCMAAELFGSQLADHLGVRAPKVRLVKRDHAEGQAIHDAVLAFDERLAERNGKTRQMLSQPFYLIMEYAPGTSLEELHPGHELCLEIFGKVAATTSDDEGKGEQEDAVAAAAGGALSDRVQHICDELGRMVAYDFLINNFDRLPTVWDAKGNEGNVMLGKASAAKDGDDHITSVISIDNMAACIQEGFKAFEPTLAKMREAVEGMLMSESICSEAGTKATKVKAADATTPAPNAAKMRVQPAMDRIRVFLRDGKYAADGTTQLWLGLGRDIQSEGTRAIQASFLKTVQSDAYRQLVRDGLFKKWHDEIYRVFMLTGDDDRQDKVFKPGDRTWGLELVHPVWCEAVSRMCLQVAGGRAKALSLDGARGGGAAAGAGAGAAAGVAAGAAAACIATNNLRVQSSGPVSSPRLEQLRKQQRVRAPMRRGSSLLGTKPAPLHIVSHNARSILPLRADATMIINGQPFRVTATKGKHIPKLFAQKQRELGPPPDGERGFLMRSLSSFDKEETAAEEGKGD